MRKLIVSLIAAFNAFFAYTSIQLAWSAFQYPLELEARESTGWLHVLTFDAQIGIFDALRVAYVNLNHGPIDPLIKFALYKLAPWLTSYQNTRIFALLLPFAFIFFSYAVLSKVVTSKFHFVERILIFTGPGLWMYLFAQKIQPYVFLTGRWDPTATFFLIITIASVLFRTHKNKSPLGFWPGVFASLVVFTCLRFTVYSLSALLGSALLFYKPSQRFLNDIGKCLLGLILVPALLIPAVYQWNPQNYLKYSFGFYTSAGHGLGKLNEFFLLPHEVKHPSGMFLWIMLNLVVVLLFSLNFKKITHWLFVILLLCIFTLTSYGYYLNGAGGGPYYYIPFFTLLWGFSIYCFKHFSKNQIIYIILLCSLLTFRMSNRGALRDQINVLKNTRPLALKLFQNLQDLDVKDGVHTENLFLFRTKYQNDKIDMGDDAGSLYQKQPTLYGKEFDNRITEYFTGLKNQLPKYLYGDFVDSYFIRQIKKTHYNVLNSAPTFFLVNGQGLGTLYELKKEYLK